MFKDKKVLITGGLGMIGKELKILLEELGAKVFIADLKIGNDLTEYGACLQVCKDKDYVFHLAGVKGSPKLTNERPLDFFEPMIQFNTNMIKAARECEVKRFLYTSSIAVENLETDLYPAWAKLTGEHQIEASRIQYPEGTQYCIVRPANVYGRFDDFNNPNAMVITALIKKARNPNAKYLEVWGSGTQVRDFINAKDCARGMIKALEEMPGTVNLCSGVGVTIKEIAEIIAKLTNKQVKYDTTKPRGAESRVMANPYIQPKINIVAGIKEIIEWIK